MRLDALPQRHARCADVRGVGEDFLGVDEAAERMVVMNLEAAVMQRAACIPHRVERRLAGVERHRQRERLEGRAHFIDAGGQAIDAIRIVGLFGIVRIEIRQRHHGDDLAGPDVGDETRCGFRLVVLLGFHQLVAQRMLDAQIDRELDRPLQPIGGEARAMQVGEAVGIEPLLDTGDALVVDVHEADQMRNIDAVGIDPLVLAQEADAGNAETMDVLLLFRRDFALQPDEALLRRQAVAHFARIEIGQRRSQQFYGLVLVDDPAGLAEQRRRLDVGRQDLAVAIHNVRTRRGDSVLRGGAARSVVVADHGEHHQPQADHRVHRGEHQHAEADAHPRARGTIDILAVKQAAHQPLVPRLDGAKGADGLIAHRLSSAVEIEPVWIS